jgi:hypothetical protein
MKTFAYMEYTLGLFFASFAGKKQTQQKKVPCCRRRKRFQAQVLIMLNAEC